MADPHHVAAILDNSRHELAEAITDRHYQLHPELAERFGPAGRSHCRQDTEYHLSYLSAAVATETPAFFAEYVGWCKTMLGARGIGAGDLAENLRTLREVLERSLPPDVCILAVPPVHAGLAELGRVAAAPSSLLAEDGGPLAQLAHDYLSALLRAERHLASSLILAAADAGTPIRDLYLRVFQPSQHEVGRLWQMNQISVAQEHYCTAATQLIMSQLYPYIFSGERRSRTLVAACVDTQPHLSPYPAEQGCRASRRRSPPGSLKTRSLRASLRGHREHRCRHRPPGYASPGASSMTVSRRLRRGMLAETLAAFGVNS
jgi:hypothetical protein